jgi:HK97 gp10 family phage protein
VSQYLTGDDVLLRKLQSLSKKDSKAAVRKGTRAGAKIVQAKAQELAPYRTGKLKRGIKVRAMPRSKKWFGTMVRGTNYKGEEFYGGFQEYGWRHGPRKLGDARKKIEGLHFMQRAAQEAGPRAIEEAKRVIAEEIVARATA